jgi:HD-GYP domain-containing protein (c-di-GMP phosphodiesterase class II)
MTSNRAYRPAKSWDAALEELRRGSRSQWNPKVVDAALTALQPAPSMVVVSMAAATAGA